MEPGRLELEHHQLDRLYERLRLRQEAAEQRLLGSLALRGQQVPIVVVVAAEEAGRYRVIDGFRRLRALERLGEDTVWATVWDLPELEALLLARGLRGAAETAIEQAWLLTELAQRFGLDGLELARRFDRSPSWVSRRLALVKVLPAAVLEAVRQGTLAAHTAMRHLVPLARANRPLCRDLAEAAARHRLSSRETAALVRWVQRTPRAHRPRVLADPRLALRSLLALRDRPAGHQPPGWLDELEAAASALARLQSTVPPLATAERRRAVAALNAARDALSALGQALGEAPSC